jgi:hypothetical protein
MLDHPGAVPGRPQSILIGGDHLTIVFAVLEENQAVEAVIDVFAYRAIGKISSLLKN